MILKDKYVDIKENTCESILFVGDIHGEFGEIRNNCRLYPNTMQFYCGDIGMGFYKTNYYNVEFNKINEKAKRYNCIIILIRGNHDNPMYFYNNVDGWDPSIYSNIWMSQDWQVFGTQFGNVLCGGGAVSVDRAYRQEDKTWWRLEEIDYQPFTGMFESIGDHKIDIVATHTAPISFFPLGNKALNMRWFDDEIIKACDHERGYLDELKKYIEDKFREVVWFYGHFHNHYYAVSGKVIAYGLDINEVKEVVLHEV